MPETLSSPEPPAESLVAARLLRRTLRQWPIILVCAVVAAVAGYFASASRTNVYEATTTLQLSEIDLSSLFLAQNLQQQGQDAAAKAATNAKLITLPRVRQRVSEQLGGQVSPDELKDNVTVSTEAGTTLVEISAKNPDPQLATRIADETRDAFIKTRRLAAVTQFRNARNQLERQLGRFSDEESTSPAAEVIRGRLEQIDTLISVSNGGVETVQVATLPDAPVSPNPKRDALIALLIGGLFGLAFAVLRARIDRRIRDVKELAELWELPALGLIPESSDLKTGSGRGLPGGPVLEAFGLARTNLRYLHLGNDVKTLVVTSAMEGEGKSTVAWNLAVAAAMADARVLLIEADLRRPVLAGRLGLSVRHGLSEVLAGMATTADAITPVHLGAGRGATPVEVAVLPAGLVPPSPIALLERREASSLLDTARADYDLVIIDTPPATVVADAKVLAAHADGVVVVSRLGRLTSDRYERLRDLLGGSGAPVLGTIVNGGASSGAYGYSSYTASATTPEPDSSSNGKSPRPTNGSSNGTAPTVGSGARATRVRS